MHFPDHNNTSCLTLLSVSATGVKLQQPLPKPEHRRREFTCLQVCHHHCHLCFCPVMAGSCHLPRTGNSTAHTLSWHVDLCRELPICSVSTFPSAQIPAPGGVSQGLRMDRDTMGGTSMALSSSREPFHGVHHSSPSAPNTLCPLQALWDDATAVKVPWHKLNFWIQWHLPQVHPRTPIPISQSNRVPSNKESCFKSDDGFHFTLMSRYALYPYL